MQDTTTAEQLMQAHGQPVYSSDGEKIGKIEEVYVDDDTGRPEWLGLGTGLLGTKRVLVPVQGLAPQQDGFSVPYAKDQVQETPDIDDDHVSQETESRLYAHYGLEYGESRSETGLPEGRSQGRSSVDESDVVRSEEELSVGKRDVETGRARLRKWVETEPVEMDVELRRETARVTREPIDEPVSGAEIGDQEIDVPLHGEEAVVGKQTVAKERISVDKDVETERKKVSDEVRKERVDIEEGESR